jgi:hypothetical protein
MLMFSARHGLIVLCTIVGLGLANPAVANGDYAVINNGYGTSNAPSAVAMGADALLVRPLSLAATVLGSAVFVVSLPLSLLGMNAGQAADRLVVEPAKYTFVRPLGDFQANRPQK